MRLPFLARPSKHEALLTCSDVLIATNAAYRAWEDGDISITPLGATEMPSEEVIYRQMEQQHCVKRLATLAEQTSDSAERVNLITVKAVGGWRCWRLLWRACLLAS